MFGDAVARPPHPDDETDEDLKLEAEMDNQHRKITGYRELDEAEIALMNEIKAQGLLLQALLLKVAGAQGDARWAAIAKTHFQEGLMGLTRAVSKPDFF